MPLVGLGRDDFGVTMVLSDFRLQSFPSNARSENRDLSGVPNSAPHLIVETRELV